MVKLFPSFSRMSNLLFCWQRTEPAQIFHRRLCKKTYIESCKLSSELRRHYRQQPNEDTTTTATASVDTNEVLSILEAKTNELKKALQTRPASTSNLNFSRNIQQKIGKATALVFISIFIFFLKLYFSFSYFLGLRRDFLIFRKSLKFWASKYKNGTATKRSITQRLCHLT